MKAYVKNFRRGKNTSYSNQIIIEAEEIENRESAAEYVGKEVIYTTEGGKEIKGKITSPHGNSGAMRVRFNKGAPGEIPGSTVEIKE